MALWLSNSLYYNYLCFSETLDSAFDIKGSRLEFPKVFFNVLYDSKITYLQVYFFSEERCSPTQTVENRRGNVRKLSYNRIGDNKMVTSLKC